MVSDGPLHDSLMDQLSTVMGIKWNAPYRSLASVAGLLAIASLFMGLSPLQLLAETGDALGLAGSRSWIEFADDWVASRTLVIAIPGTLFLIAGVAFAYRRGRGAASAVLGAAALIQAGGAHVLIPAIVVVVVLLAWIASRIFAHRIFDPFDDPTRHFGTAIGALISALAWVVVGPLSWAVRRT